jgi:hypothetical protein
MFLVVSEDSYYKEHDFSHPKVCTTMNGIYVGEDLQPLAQAHGLIYRSLLESGPLLKVSRYQDNASEVKGTRVSCMADS